MYNHTDFTLSFLDYIMDDTNVRILSILKHNFKLGLKAAVASLEIHEVEDEDKISVWTTQN